MCDTLFWFKDDKSFESLRNRLKKGLQKMPFEPPTPLRAWRSLGFFALYEDAPK
ncbi:MAG: hypothetical protein ACLR56_01670 [Oscillospiraceae bacterium]